MTTPFTLPDLERPAFFDGQHLTAADLAAVQRFHRELRWLHNRSLHSWGIVFGCVVSGARGARVVHVQPGYALDSRGRELILREPLELAIPAVAGASKPVRYYLTMSHAENANLAIEARNATAYTESADPVVETRAGSCGTSGAVRYPELPLIRWQSPDETGPGRHRPGEDIVLATVVIQNCRLTESVSSADRRAAVASQPYVAAGRTPIDGKLWRLWRGGGTGSAIILGFETTVDTSAARFSQTPHYTARVGGGRVLQAPQTQTVVVEAFAAVIDPRPNSFVLQVLARGRLPDGSDVGPLRVDQIEQLQWHVVWMGIEG